jgi:hypothetical protein
MADAPTHVGNLALRGSEKVIMKKSNDIADLLASVKSELPPSSEPNQPDETAIAARAFEIYESKGRINGGDLRDWLQAKRDLKQ